MRYLPRQGPEFDPAVFLRKDVPKGSFMELLKNQPVRKTNSLSVMEPLNISSTLITTCTISSTGLSIRNSPSTTVLMARPPLSSRTPFRIFRPTAESRSISWRRPRKHYLTASCRNYARCWLKETVSATAMTPTVSGAPVLRGKPSPAPKTRPSRNCGRL